MRRSINIMVPEHVKEFLLNCFGTDEYVCPELDSFIGRLLQLAAEKTNTVKLSKKDIVPEGWVSLEVRIPASLADYNFTDYTLRNMGRLLEQFYKMGLGFFVWGAKDYQPRDQTITTSFLEKTRTRGLVDDNSARRMGVNIVTFFNDKYRRQSKRGKNFSKKNRTTFPQKS